MAAVTDGTYDTQLCHDELRSRNISSLIPPQKGTVTLDSRRSIAETAMYMMIKAGMPESIRIA